ncbi:hypothetical protein HUJ04_005131 [Dendroctonus ponderosae]|nr:hypothetical protein HUJ04_005131 [Dendroctonus ponderosae]
MHNIKYHRYISKSYCNQSDLTKSLEKSSSENVSSKAPPSDSKSDTLKKSQQIVKPPIPQNIPKERAGLWIAWTYKRDREVVREAASKGHVELAVQFIHLRRNLDEDIVKNFINTEVLIWVDELLDRKLISRVTIILKHIGLDPFRELQRMFYETTDSDRRQYIGNHLSDKNELSSNYKRLWTFLDVVLDNKVLSQQYSLLYDSIEVLDKVSQDWKDQTAVRLFMATQDARLIPLIKADVLWEYLLKTKELDYLIAWIQLAYSSHTKISNIPEPFLLVLKSFEITDDMIDYLSDLISPSNRYEEILNELVLFGRFIDSERMEFLKVLSRVNSADSLINIYQILEQPYSNLSLTEFTFMLIDHCLNNDLLVVLNACAANLDLSFSDSLSTCAHLDLIVNFIELISNLDEEHLGINIFKVSKYLNKDLNKFLCDNPMIVFALLLFFSDGTTFINSMQEKSLVFHNIQLYDCLSNAMGQFRMLSDLYVRHRGVKCNLTYMDLLEKKLGIEVKKVFAFYFDHSPLQTFSSSAPRPGSVYSKKVTCSFYLKHCRPSIASQLFNQQFGHDDEAKIMTQQKVYKIAMKNFQNLPLVTSCICFLGMIGASSQCIRVSIKAANILFESGMDQDNVISLFISAEQHRSKILKLLENNLLKSVNFTNMMSSGEEFVRAVKQYDVVVNFSDLSNTPLPNGLLKNLAQRNLWFPFLLFAQLKNYPIDQIKELCSHFKNPNLLEHIVHSVLHDIQIDDSNILMKDRDSRKYPLSKLVPKSMDEGSDSKLLLSGSMEGNSSSNSEFLEIDPSNTKVTLLQILIRCHNSADPPRALLQASQLYRNPLLAIFASSYEPDSVITNWLTWLAVSTELYEAFSNFDLMSSSSHQVTSLLNSCMTHQFPKTLLQSCIIFIPENPLTSFCDFLNRLIFRDYEIECLAAKLSKFNKLKTSRRPSTLSQTDYELTYMRNKVWLEETALQLLCSALVYNTNSLFDRLQFVEALCLVNMDTYFTCPIPNFKSLAVILKIMFDTGVHLDLIGFLNVNQEDDAVKNCINELIELNLYSDAVTIAICSNINTDRILLSKWEKRLECSTDFEGDLLECDKDFQAHNVSPQQVVAFLIERNSANEFQQYCLLKLSHKWAVTHELPNKYELEQKKISSYTKLDTPISIDELNDGSVRKDFTTYSDMLDLLDKIKPLDIVVTPEQMRILDAIFIQALGQRDFWLALKLEKMFGCKNSDMEILKLCHELAEGMLMPYQLNEDQQHIIARVKEIQRIRRRRSAYISNSFSADVNYLELIEEEENKQEEPILATQGLIHCLIEKLHHGSELAYYIFMKYRISYNIELPYNVVVSNVDPMVMLKMALQDGSFNTIEVVHDCFEVFNWSKEQMTDLICDRFVAAATKYSQSKIEVFTMWGINVVDQFHLILNLIRDECSTLGNKFYNHATELHKKQMFADVNFKISEMALVVELLIAAHSCFTVDCNMEGISSILKKCRNVIDNLLQVRSWKLIVRLLTGVGRYTELKYVFYELKRNDQFEFLLSKGSKRDERLKLACIEYLKKTCLQDMELYKLVAIHFNLYSDVAALWEREAQGHIKNLLLVSEIMNDNPNAADPMEFIYLIKAPDTDFLLNKAMNKYIQAAEFHVQGEKLSSAMNAARQAELIALQKSLFNSVQDNEEVPAILNLTTKKITKLMCTRLSFHQSNILAQAYNVFPVWQRILYEQVIKNDNITYFNEFAETIGVTDELLQDIVRKCQLLQALNASQLKNIKYMIEQVESLHLKYLLASEFGFSNLVHDVINSDEIYYLKDTVYKSGYKGEYRSIL